MHIEQSSENDGRQQRGPTEPVRIAIFDDADEAIGRFRRQFEGRAAQIEPFRSPVINQKILDDLMKLRPQLIVVDLMMGDSRQDGLDVIKQLQRVPDMSDVPIIVCSKFINDTEPGTRERKK